MQQPYTITLGEEDRVLGQLWLPNAQGAPLVILIHGGFWRSGKTLHVTDPLAASLAVAGIAVWNIEYRAGACVDWRTTLDDVATAIDHTVTLCRRYPIGSGRPTFVGHSAGGQLALWAAARSKLKQGGPCQHPSLLPAAVISLAGVCDLVAAAESHLGEDAVAGFLGGPPNEVVSRYQSACPSRLLPLGVRQLIVHGAEDARVPSAMSRRYAAAATIAGDPVELIELPCADHRSLIDPNTEAGHTVAALITRIAGEAQAGDARRNGQLHDGYLE